MRPEQHVLSTSVLFGRFWSAGRLFTLCLVIAAWAAVGLAQVHTDFPITTAGSGPEGIVTGPDGNLWFCEEFADKIGRITPDGTVTEFPIPTAGAHPETIIVGPDGAMWFTELLGNKIGRITTAGVITEFTIPTAHSEPEGVALGPDGNIWFPETDGNKIGRLTTSGVFTEFPIPTPASHPEGGIAGPDVNLWFVENFGKKVLRVTTAGAMTEFPIPTATAAPWNIALGPDGNLWFTEGAGEKIGRITPAGVITEFPVTTPGTPDYIVGGPDGNIWYTEYYGNLVGRITPSGVITEFPIAGSSHPYGIGTGPDGAVWFCEQGLNKIGRLTTGPAIPDSMDVDASGNHVLEAGETAVVAPTWTNTLVTGQALTGAATGLTGPGGPTYTINDSTADYGTIAAESSGSCATGGDCYEMTISGSRPAPHWDATFTETLTPGPVTKSWKLHVGGSFPDVPTSHQFYAFIENLFHNAVTGGCTGGNYCPANPVTRAQMAVFLMKGRQGATLYTPPPATGTVFLDVHIGDFAADWIEALAGFQITGGCGNGNYCPSSSVTRAQMAVFLLKAEHGSAYTPPGCTGVFNDVPCPSQFADWIEQLADEGITGGCGGGNYCPNDPITRGQMAVFLVKTFKLLLYGP